MKEIEKLYSLAGVEPQKQCYYWDCPYSTGEVMLDLQKEKDCANCKNPDKAVYPSFTAEKQLELLKICFDKYERLEKVRGLKERCIIYYHFESNGYTEFVNCETWEETIAGLINNLWQDLTEAEQNEIRGILE